MSISFKTSQFEIFCRDCLRLFVFLGGGSSRRDFTEEENRRETDGEWHDGEENKKGSWIGGEQSSAHHRENSSAQSDVAFENP